jgi:hypothetical protein
MATIAVVKAVEHWPIDKLIPYAENPRVHSDAKVGQIAGSIPEFGFTSPILVDSRAGIIAGHGRLLGARKLNLSTVPVMGVPLVNFSLNLSGCLVFPAKIGDVPAIFVLIKCSQQECDLGSSSAVH